MKKFLPLFLFLFLFSKLFADVPVFYGEELIVVATKSLLPVSKTFQKVRVITQDEIKKSGVKTVSEAIDLVSTIKVKSTGYLGSISSTRMKSATASQVLLLLDGQKINSPLLGMFDLNDIQVSDVERIEIVEDSLSYLFGADAVGGAINIVTKDDKSHKINAAISYGSYNQSSYSVSAASSLANLSFGFDFNNLRTDGFRQNSDYKNNSLSLFAEYAGNLMIKYRLANSDRGNPGVPPSDNDSWAASTPNDRQKDFYGNLLIDIKGDYFGLLDKISFSENVQNENVHFFDVFSGSFTDEDYFGRILTLNAQKSISFSNSNLIYGCDFKRSDGKSAKTGEHSIDNSSIFLNLSSNIDLPLAANFGLRYDDSKVWGSQLTPAVLMRANLGEFGRLKYSFSKSFRAPTINELYWDEPSWGMFGNPNLKPEKGSSFGVYYEKDLYGSNIELGYYQNNISDMITWKETSPFVWQTTNIDSAKIEGVTFGIKKELIKGVRVFVDYNNESVVDLSSQKTIPYSPAYKINSGIELFADGLTINLRSKDVSQVFTDSNNLKTLPAYRVVDLTLLKKIYDIIFSASVMNLFNETYYESVGNSQVDWKERPYPMPGRRFEIRLSY